MFIEINMHYTELSKTKDKVSLIVNRIYGK